MKKGFTLIELLMTVTIISLLAVTVFVALNPVQRLKDTKDARRTTDADTILTAIHQYIVDKKGTLPTGLSTGMAITMLGTGSSGCAATPGPACGSVGTACVDVMNASNPTTNLTPYLKSMPIDPNGSTGSPAYTAARTGYAVTIDSNGIVTVTACNGESSTITVSR